MARGFGQPQRHQAVDEQGCDFSPAAGASTSSAECDRFMCSRVKFLQFILDPVVADRTGEAVRCQYRSLQVGACRKMDNRSTESCKPVIKLHTVLYIMS